MVGSDVSVRSLAVSRIGNRAALGTDEGAFCVWDLERRNRLAYTFAHEDSIHAVAFSPDGTWIVSASNDWTAKVWNASDATPIEMLWLTNSRMRRGGSPWGDTWRSGYKGVPVPNDVVFSPDSGRFACSVGAKDVQVWDSMSRTLQATFSSYAGQLQTIAFSPDGSRIACNSLSKSGEICAITVWDLSSGDEVLCIPSITSGEEDVAPVRRAIEFSPDGNRLLSATTPPALWDSRSGEQILTLQGHSGRVLAATFNIDGTRIATAGIDCTIRIWDSNSGQELLSLSTATPQQFLFFCDQGRKLISAGADGVITIWDASRKMPVEGAKSGLD
jgi:WD40 repeat protein